MAVSQFGGHQNALPVFRLDHDFTEIQHLCARSMDSLQQYCQALAHMYETTNDTTWLNMRKTLLEQHLGRVQSLIHYGELSKKTLQNGIAQYATVPLYLGLNVELSPYGVPTQSQGHAAHSGGPTQTGDRDAFFNRRMSYVRDHDERIIFTLKNATFTTNLNRTWDYSKDHDYRKNGILWYHGRELEPGWETKTGYIVKSTVQNLQIIEKAYRYLVEYKDLLVGELAKSEGLSLSDRRRDP
ncbi:hypothetical protein GGR53DRAFT_508711 [Hypoxylon sp. FL1150]|nr:hypothetical protein GGR53DRAFT_508711 [Hypoxylon sp. FL1150]